MEATKGLYGNNKNLIFFGISDSYSFAAANMIMGLKKYSAKFMETCDILILHDGFSERNRNLLIQLHDAIFFKEMVFPESWNEMLTDEKTVQWGSYVIYKLFGFELIQHYEKALFLDADMLVRGDISDIFQTEEEMAGRPSVAWNARENFASLLVHPDDDIRGWSGGLILFTSKLRAYNIGTDDILQAYKEARSVKRGGTEEKILIWLVYKNRISVRDLNCALYNTPVRLATADSRLIHFVSGRNDPTKPWNNLASYLYFDDWAENYQAWLAMGGDGPVSFTKEDYLKLFTMGKRILNLQASIKEKEKEISKWKAKHNAIRNSASWKVTAPFRRVMKWIRKFIKKLKR